MSKEKAAYYFYAQHFDIPNVVLAYYGILCGSLPGNNKLSDLLCSFQLITAMYILYSGLVYCLLPYHLVIQNLLAGFTYNNTQQQ